MCFLNRLFFSHLIFNKMKIKLFNTFSSSFPIKEVWEMGGKKNHKKFNKVL